MNKVQILYGDKKITITEENANYIIEENGIETQKNIYQMIQEYGTVILTILNKYAK
jgi:hypothetical protein